MNLFKTFVFSCALLSQLSASVVPSVIERFQTEDYAARQSARVELMAAFSESTVTQFDSEARAALEQELLQHVQSDAIPMDGRLYLLRMLELYGTEAAAATLSQLAQSADPVLSEAAKRALLAVEGKATPLQTQPLDATTALARLDAYHGLLANDPARALEIASELLSAPEAVGRVRVLTAAARSNVPAVRDRVLPALLAGSDAEKLIAVAAIANHHVTNYEAALLDLLPTTTGPMHNETVACLGAVGSDASFAALFTLYEANPKNPVVQTALAEVAAPTADVQALKNAATAQDSQTQIAAIQLLALRNPEGGTQLLNTLLVDGAALDPSVLKAIYQTQEKIGDVNTVQLMLKPELILSEQKRDTQRSLKRLSLSLGIPEYLWAEAFQPSLVANPGADYRAAILEIIDSVACAGSVGYLQAILENPESPDYALAYRSLQRWPQEKNLYAAEMWIMLYTAEGASEADQKKAVAAIQKMLKNRHPDYYPRQINLLLEVGKADLPVELKHALFNVYAEPGDHFYAWYFHQAKRRLQPALEMPDVADIAQQIINKL